MSTSHASRSPACGGPSLWWPGLTSEGHDTTPSTVCPGWTGPSGRGGFHRTRKRSRWTRSTLVGHEQQQETYFSILEAGLWVSPSPRVFHVCKLCGHFTSDNGPGKCGFALGQRFLRLTWHPVSCSPGKGPGGHPGTLSVTDQGLEN